MILAYNDSSTIKNGLTNFYKFDGNSIDLIGGNNGTDTSVTYVAGKVNDAASFNGASSVQLSTINMGLNWSVSFWFKPQSKGGSYTSLGSDNGASVGIYLRIGGFNKLSFFYNGDHLSNFTFVFDHWYHLVITNNNGNLNYYLNGEHDSYFLLGGSGNFPLEIIGNDAASESYAGLLDEYGIWNRTLKPYEIKALYKNGIGLEYPFTFPNRILAQQNIINKDLISYWKLNGDNKDSIGNNHGVNIGGGITYQSGFINKAAHFDGDSHNRINCGNVPMNNLTQFSVTGWIKPDNSGTNQFLLLASKWPAGNETFAFTLYASQYLVGFIGDGSGGYAYYFYDITSLYNGNNWSHCSLVYDGSQVVDADRLKAYFNGVNIPVLNAPGGTLPAIPTSLGIANGDFNIGYLDGSNYTPTGKIDEVGLWNKALNSTEILNNYNSGVGVDYSFQRILNY